VASFVISRAAHVHVVKKGSPGQPKKGRKKTREDCRQLGREKNGLISGPSGMPSARSQDTRVSKFGEVTPHKKRREVRRLPTRHQLAPGRGIFAAPRRKNKREGRRGARVIRRGRTSSSPQKADISALKKRGFAATGPRNAALKGEGGDRLAATAPMPPFAGEENRSAPLAGPREGKRRTFERERTFAQGGKPTYRSGREEGRFGTQEGKGQGV